MAAANLTDIDIEQADGAEAEEQTQKRNPMRFVLWLLVLALGLAFLPLFLVASTLKEAVGPVQLEITQVMANLSTTPEPPAEQQQLTTELNAVLAQMNSLSPVVASLNQHLDWSLITAVIASYDPLRISLKRMNYSENIINLFGQAQNQTAVTEYAEWLRRSGLFEQVVIQAIDAVTIEPAQPENPEEAPPPPITISEFTLIVVPKQMEVQSDAE